MDYIALGNRIRETRQEHHYTQIQIAEKLNYSDKHLGNVERGHARPSLELLVDFAKKLHVSTDYLLQDSLSEEESDT